MSNTRKPLVNRKKVRAEYDPRFDQFGVYVWITDDGKIVQNQNGDFMHIEAQYGDIKRIKQITDAAKHFGIPGGHAQFLPGHHGVTDEEYQEQVARLAEGLIPDKNDLSAIVEDAEDKYGKRF